MDFWFAGTLCQHEPSSQPNPGATQKGKGPGTFPYRGLLHEKPGSDLLWHGKSHTTIGAERFHFRVRNGIGWFPLAIAARRNRKFF